MLSLGAMATPLNALQRDRLRLYLRILAVSAVLGAAYGALLAQEGVPVWSSLGIGVLNGVGISGGP